MADHGVGGGLVLEGPWRATRLWNSIVRNLQEGMPLKRHRRHMKTFDDCFTASEAVEWLHKHLKRNPNFDVDVSKEQTVRLLQKLLRAGVIQRLDSDFLNSVESLDKNSSSTDSVFKSSNTDLYRLAPAEQVGLRTPGKKAQPSERRSLNAVRSPLVEIVDEPHHQKQHHDFLNIRGSFRRIRNKNKVQEEGQEGGECAKNEALSGKERENLNLSYLQSLPANSLVVLGSDSTWKEVFGQQLRKVLSDVHVNSLSPIDPGKIIYNMTKVSAKGVVQLADKRADLPHWTLSAMKCLANWPKPFKGLTGSDGAMPNYEGFEVDVFNVVKEYFASLRQPLTTCQLYDIFVSAFIKAEAVSAKPTFRRTAMKRATTCYMETDLDGSCSTPSFYTMNGRSHLSYNRERVARIRQTLEVMPPLSSHTSMSGSLGSPDSIHLSANMSATAIMRNFLPPNTCFETAFMNESPVTRIVPQKGNELLHFLPPRRRSSSRTSFCTVPIPSGGSIISSNTTWDSRSIATQTSEDEDDSSTNRVTRRQPEWKRTGRQRKSIAVMEAADNHNNGYLPMTTKSSSALLNSKKSKPKMRECSSVDNLLLDNPDDAERFLHKYQQLDFSQQQRERRYSIGAMPTRTTVTREQKRSPDNVILSKTVRKEKRRQREKRERSVDVMMMPSQPYDDSSPTSSSSLASSAGALQYRTTRYQHLTVKTPIVESAPIPYMDEGMQCARAEPYTESKRSAHDLFGMSEDGVQSAIDSFQLLALLLPPENRRKLQLLLKFMRRVAAKENLHLDHCHSKKACLDVVLDTFSEHIIKPQQDLANYDEELCRKIVHFFMEHYDDIWTPPVCLRRDVEERVYESLVSKRIEAGEDPYPITFCKRVPSKVYEREKTSGVQAAMLDLLQHILSDTKMSTREKKKKLKKFKTSYPDIYKKRFPRQEDEPDFMKGHNLASSMSSLSKLKHAVRI